MDDIAKAIAQLRDPDTTDAAVDRLDAMGERAIDSPLAAMLSLEEEERTREICAVTLGMITPRGPTELLRCLRESGEEVGDLAAWGLRWNFDPDQIEPARYEMLTDARVTMRRRAARTLRYIHVDLRRRDPRLLAAMSDEDREVRLDALHKVLDLAVVDAVIFGDDDLHVVAFLLNSPAESRHDIPKTAGLGDWCHFGRDMGHVQRLGGG